MTDERARDATDRARPGPVGSRFRRPLTEVELATVRGHITRRGAVAGFDALLDLILLEAEGTTQAQAVRAGQKFHPSDYAIPGDQAALITAWVRSDRMNRRGMRADRWRAAVTWLWFQVGPATFDR